jgi:hypothetical protein
MRKRIFWIGGIILAIVLLIFLGNYFLEYKAESLVRTKLDEKLPEGLSISYDRLGISILSNEFSVYGLEVKKSFKMIFIQCTPATST